MKIIQDKKEYNIKKKVGKIAKLRYDLKKKEVLVAGYCKHKKLPIFLYIIEENKRIGYNKENLFNIIKTIGLELKYFQANEDSSTRYTIRHIRELEFD